LPQGFKNSPTIFGTALASDLKAFSTDQHGCTLLQYVDDLLWLDQLRRTVWKGHTFSFLFYGRQDTKSASKRPKFAKTLPNTLAFTCPRGNAGSALRRNRIYVPSQPLRSTGKLENFWELQVSVKSGYLTITSWPNPSMKPQRRENGSKKKPLKKSRRH
jgi:hypothetical protein